ncbi:MAG: KdsC family phosphatase [Bacteroidales bacterium]
MLPKLIITDIDGVWTDGGMFYSPDGDFLKRFHVSDGWGVIYCKQLDIPVAIMTGENTTIVKERAKKLGIEHCYVGVNDKVAEARQLCESLNISLDEVAFIGDDLNDLALLRKVGISGCPSNAHPFVRKHVDYVGLKQGGSGAFREFVERILSDNDALEPLLAKYL